MLRKSIITTFASAMLTIGANASQPSDTVSTQALLQKIDSLSSRLDQVEHKQSAWEKVKPYLPKISGYLQAGYNYNSAGEGISTFQVKRLRLIIDGNVTARASYKIQIEALSGVNVGGRWENQKIFHILDAFATYRFLDGLQLRAGQFSSPAGYENYNVSPLTNVTIDYAPICSRMVLRNAVGYNYTDFGRDIGVMLMGNLFPASDGSFHRLQYNLAVTNGHLPTVNDNNKSKDIIAALMFWPTSRLNIKASYTWGEYTPDTFSGNLDINTYPWNEVAGDKYVPLHRAIAGIWYNDPGGLYLRAEYGHLDSHKNGAQLVKEDGFYCVAAYKFGKWLPVVRFDWYKDHINPNLLDNRVRGLAGCTFIPNSHIKVQLNYLLSRYNRQAADALNKGRLYSSELLLMALLSF